MSTLEDRLRAALTAKSDAVAFSMLTRSLPTPDTDPELDAAPVLLLPPHRPHRAWHPVAVALAVAAVLLVAFGAVALHRTTHRFDPAHVRPRSAIPWNQVGPGWTLVQDTPHTNRNVDYTHFDAPERLLLISPQGDEYLITEVGLGSRQWYLTDWSGSSENALLYPAGEPEQKSTSVLVVNLHTGTSRTITAPGNFDSTRFSGPADQSILFEDYRTLATYSLTGQPLARFAGTGPGPNAFTASSADGNQIITGSKNGLAVRDAKTGRLVRTLAPPAGFTGCSSPQWQPHGELVASCDPAKPSSTSTAGTRLVTFSNGHALAPGRIDSRLNAGGWALGLRQGYLAVFTKSFPNFEADDTAVRFDDAGHRYPIQLPAILGQGGWSVDPDSVGLDTLNLVHFTAGDPGNRLMDSWNPFTGKVTELYRAATPTGVLLVDLPWREPHG